MASIAPAGASIFAPATVRERAENFENYWVYLRHRDGELLEAERALANKQRVLAHFQDHPVRSRRPLATPERF